MKIDLHAHSTASDGVLTPEQLIERAHAHGIQVFALTDHDTLKGIEPARAAANKLGMHLVNGIELSCVWGGATIHILGYDFDLENKELNDIVNDLFESRVKRAEEISKRLAKVGFHNALEATQAIQLERGQTDTPPARPHFAEFLVRSSYAKDYAEAFKKWLGAGKLGDVKQHWPSLDSVMHALTRANAKISLAHPYHYNFTRSKRLRLVQEFIALGGHAIEVSNGMQPAEQVGTLSAIARENKLSVTAGSDFHLPQTYSEIGRYRAPADDLPCLWHEFSLPHAIQITHGVK